MDLKQIHDLIKVVNKSNIGEISIEDKDGKVTIKQKEDKITVTSAPAQTVYASAPAAAPSAAAPVASTPAAAPASAASSPSQRIFMTHGRSALYPFDPGKLKTTAPGDLRKPPVSGVPATAGSGKGNPVAPSSSAPTSPSSLAWSPPIAHLPDLLI